MCINCEEKFFLVNFVFKCGWKFRAFYCFLMHYDFILGKRSELTQIVKIITSKVVICGRNSVLKRLMMRGM